MAGGGNTLLRNVSSGAVAAIAAWSSYSHMVHLAVLHGERAEVAWALPLSVDGMLIVSTIVMVDDKRHGTRVRPMARFAFTIGVIASIAANIAAAHPTLGARIIAAWPAVALLLVVEMLARPPAGAVSSGQPAAGLPVMVQQPPPRAEVPAVRQVPPPVEAEVPPQASRCVEVPPAGNCHPAPATATYTLSSPGRQRADRLQGAGTSLHAVGGERTIAHEVPVAAHRRPGGRTAEGPAVEPAAPQRPGSHGRADGPVPAEPLEAAAKAELPPAAEPARLGPSTEPLVPADVRFQPPTGEVPVTQWRSTAGVAEAVPVCQQKPAGKSSADYAAAGRATATATGRRPTAATRQLAQTIMAAEPHLSRTEVAKRLGVSTRRLREVLAA